jgi:hypothetical protein
LEKINAFAIITEEGIAVTEETYMRYSLSGVRDFSSLHYWDFLINGMLVFLLSVALSILNMITR